MSQHRITQCCVEMTKPRFGAINSICPGFLIAPQSKAVHQEPLYLVRCSGAPVILSPINIKLLSLGMSLCAEFYMLSCLSQACSAHVSCAITSALTVVLQALQSNQP